jgi:hypothetical protein
MASRGAAPVQRNYEDVEEVNMDDDEEEDDDGDEVSGGDYINDGSGAGGSKARGAADVVAATVTPPARGRLRDGLKGGCTQRELPDAQLLLRPAPPPAEDEDSSDYEIDEIDEVVDQLHGT